MRRPSGWARTCITARSPWGRWLPSTATPPNAVRLGGDVGSALAASGLVHARVYYELDTASGKSYFVGKERMAELLAAYPDLQEKLMQETSESAGVIGKYLYLLREREDAKSNLK